ncbi:MAG: hypothetical protein J6C46_02930 [Clostridia bacterium]|nr:hypothetical protein [Clostridia bacterium]
MNPKCIIIKSQSKDFANALIYKLNEVENLRFFSFKLNGFFTIVIKCQNYYNSKIKLKEKTLYGSYIFVYSVLSIILSDLFISHYEHSISKRIILSRYKAKINSNKFSNISALLLDENSPFEFSKILFLKRKKYILDSLLHNFRKCNYIFSDYFIDFSSKKYIEELNKIIDVSTEILNNKHLYDYIMNFIFKNET